MQFSTVLSGAVLATLAVAAPSNPANSFNDGTGWVSDDAFSLELRQNEQGGSVFLRANNMQELDEQLVNSGNYLTNIPSSAQVPKDIQVYCNPDTLCAVYNGGWGGVWFTYGSENITISTDTRCGSIPGQKYRCLIPK